MKKTPISKRFINCSKNYSVNQYIDAPNVTFLGGRCDQSFTAFYIWEKFFTEHAQEMKRFIEFGCDLGNTSVYFSLWCHTLGADFIGYDRRPIDKYKKTPAQRLLRLSEKMRIGNGYKKAKEIRKTIQKSGMSVIFTDCIDKPLEFEMFAPMLKKGDVLAVHDWDRAINEEWAKDTIESIKPFELLYEQDRIELATLTKFFKKQ